jgi:glycosyltransferase involved in cell wall biosynthesis
VPGARLFVAGGDHPGEHRGHAAELAELVRTCGVEDGVVFLGRVDDPSGLVAAADICVLASDSEGLSNSLLEYACAKRAIVCTDVGGNPEIVRTPQDGLLYRPGDVETLAAHLTALLIDPQRAAALGEHVARSVRSRFSTSLLLREHLSVYARA